MADKKNNKSQEHIHLKFDYPEAVNSKKSLLILEERLITLAKTRREYASLRREELKLKSKLQREMKSLKSSIQKIQKIFPKVKMPSFLKEEEKEEKPKEETSEKETKETQQQKTPNSDLEKELKEIREKIRKLEA